MMKIAIQNVSTVLTDAEVQAAVPALQEQISRDFAPHYDDAQLCFYKRGDGIPSDHALVVVSDDADQAGELGVHDIQSNGMPLGKVFAATTKRFGGLWIVTASHELLEMIADPFINLMVMRPDGSFIAYEVCDAVEDDSLGYLVGLSTIARTVSDFVLPAWFDPTSSSGVPVSGPFSFRGNVTQPLVLATGGYIGVYTPGKGWTQETARKVVGAPLVTTKNTHDAIARPGSRRERRVRGHRNWNLMTYQP